ncbi:MAG: disulfide oxidoreductase [Actinomycetota bacterium]
MSKRPPIGPDTLVGDILRAYPELREKVAGFFGPECVACRSNRHETVTYTSWHRGLDPEAVVRALNEALKGKQA